jgi:NAD(P)-dependent dehydrogenase (short-subunit alcohol dehydrogenase family)
LGTIDTATMPPKKLESFGSQVPMDRPAQPDEIAPSYLFFAAGGLLSYYSGEVLAPIGGENPPRQACSVPRTHV